MTETTLKQGVGYYLHGVAVGLAIAGVFVPVGIGLYFTYGLWAITFVLGMLLIFEKI